MGIDLNKRTENAQGTIISLLKREQAKGIDLGEVSARVVVAIDYSASMGRMYRDGVVQDLVERVLAMSLAGLDDDGDIQVHFFHSEPFAAEEVNKDTYSGFVDRWTRSRSMGGTNYLGVIDNIINESTNVNAASLTPAPPTGKNVRKGLFGRKTVTEPVDNSTVNLVKASADIPTLVLFVTDGESSNQNKIMKRLAAASGLPIFWQFLGLGYTPKFLEDLDEMSGRVVDNVGLTSVTDLKTTSDEQFFTEMLDEFMTSWLPQARQLGIVTR